MNKKEFHLFLNKQKKERDAITEKIVNSLYPKKVIVSGPGTGKTYIFKEILQKKEKNCLALTFINNLAKKLEIEIGYYAKVCTFHSFCKEMLHKMPRKDLSNDFILFPHLELIIKSDASIVFNKNPEFSRSFHKIDLSNNNICFYLKRSSYYNAVSFDDSVYRVMEYFKYNSTHVPSYDQIVVDEYQDFNHLEVSLIDILAEKSPILIVGDDDQALYGPLKSASAIYIRDKYNDPAYENYYLPFCSRCPSVVINTVNDIIFKAKEIGRLNKRINKIYKCYLPDKLDDCKKYPKIIYAKCSTQTKKVPYIAKFIEKEIDKLSNKEVRAVNIKGDYTVLVAGSGYYLKQVKGYFDNTEKYKLFFKKEEAKNNKIKSIDGYKILLKNNKISNLGWRILLEIDKPKNIKVILRESIKNPNLMLNNILDTDYIEKHTFILNSLRQTMKGEAITPQQQNCIESSIDMPIEEIRKEIEYDGINNFNYIDEGDKNDISIAFSTYVGCKGLSAGYVFIIGLDEKNLPRKNQFPTDAEICKLIVAITRTIKKCYIISTSRFSGEYRNPSIFTKWIDKTRLEKVIINKLYFSNYNIKKSYYNH